MSRIVVLEVPDEAEVSMRDILLKAKELDTRIEARVSMPFEHWVELNQFYSADETDYIPAFPHRNKNETKEEMIKRYEKLATFILESKRTPIEKRTVVTQDCNTTEITCYNCKTRFQYRYEKDLILRKRAHGLVVRHEDSTVEVDGVGCPKCKDRSSLHFDGEIYDTWSATEKRWVL
jgi:hypothetical protein